MNPKNEQPSTVFISVNPRYSADAGKHGKIDPVGTDEIDPVKTA